MNHYYIYNLPLVSASTGIASVGLYKAYNQLKLEIASVSPKSLLIIKALPTGRTVPKNSSAGPGRWTPCKEWNDFQLEVFFQLEIGFLYKSKRMEVQKVSVI